LYGPLDGNRWTNDAYFEDGRTRAKQGEEDYVVWDRVSPHYFETAGTAVMRGRAIDDSDTPTSRHVAVVNETFVRRYFPNSDPIGQHFGLTPDRRGGYEIVGVVEDAQFTSARDAAEPMAFMPFFQIVHYKEPDFRSGEIRSNYIQDVELRVRPRAQNVAPLIRSALASIDPNLPVIEIRSLSDQVNRNFNQERLTARLTGWWLWFLLPSVCTALLHIRLRGGPAKSVFAWRSAQTVAGSL
jgi:macrolide transport system ATP-binding/permease protein